LTAQSTTSPPLRSPTRFSTRIPARTPGMNPGIPLSGRLSGRLSGLRRQLFVQIRTRDSRLDSQFRRRRGQLWSGHVRVRPKHLPLTGTGVSRRDIDRPISHIPTAPLPNPLPNPYPGTIRGHEPRHSDVGAAVGTAVGAPPPTLCSNPDPGFATGLSNLKSLARRSDAQTAQVSNQRRIVDSGP